MGKKRNDDKRRAEALVAYGRISGMAEIGEMMIPSLLQRLPEEWCKSNRGACIESFVTLCRKQREDAEREIAKLMKRNVK